MFVDIESENIADVNQPFLEQLSNICHCMMYLHTGFPELYSPILEVIKVWHVWFVFVSL